MVWFEAIGWLGALLLAAGFATQQLLRRRWILVGASVALLVHAAGAALTWGWGPSHLGPTAFVAASMLIYNLAVLRRELRPAASGDIAAIELDPQHPFMQDFLRANLPDIMRSQPEFSLTEDYGFVRLMTRHGLPAGVVVGRPVGTELHIVLDYATPRYRDSRQGRWMVNEGKQTFTAHGFSRLIANPVTHEHQNYLEALGFRHEGSWLVKEL